MKTPEFFKRSELTATLWTFRREFLMVGFFSMVANVLMLTPTLYMLQVYDRVMASQSELTLLAMSLLTLALFGVMAFAEWMRSLVLVRTGVRLDERLGTQVFNASFESHLSQSGSSPARSFGDLIQVRQFLTGNGIFAFFDAPWAPIYIAVLFMMHPWLGIMGIVFSIFQVLLAWLGHRQTLAPSEAAVAANSDSAIFLQSKLRNAEVIESMGMLGNLRKRWAQRHLAALDQGSAAQALSHRVLAWSKFIRYSQQSLALGAGALLVIDGQITPGAMIASNVLMSRALAPIDQIVSGWRGFISAIAAFGRLETLLLGYPSRDAALSRVAPKGQMSLREVVATAPGRAQPILKSISLSVSEGDVLVVLGPSGSGKSTLARVMMGIWPHVAGEVLLDGLPLNGWDRIELGPHLGYLPQDIELFEGTLAENIARFGKVDSEQVIKAATCAGLHDMILRFPKGYDTSIGEAGSMLSGGQRQRIGLARAVYGDPALIVLDEPNSNLDDAGELALIKTVKSMKALGKTVILITHRPGILAVADRLLILQDGRVQAEGPRDSVLAALQAATRAPKASAPVSSNAVALSA
ncbi:MAG: type I secretion system permease/ATPase [Rhodoferax sp.]|jgi:ATP-binding cassette subfamily C exporter for protease/lipase|nr:type I secretion system permease/ATPase [Rhodoferax sp.]